MVRDVSLVSPYEVRETVTTVANTRDISIASITDYITIVKAEYYVDKTPKQFRDVEVFGTTLTLDIDWTPSGSESVYLYCAKMHAVEELSSTLKPHEEHVVIEGLRDITIRGCGGQRWDKALEHIQAGTIKTNDLVTQVFPFEEVKEAFETQLDSEKAIKVLIEMP